MGFTFLKQYCTHNKDRGKKAGNEMLNIVIQYIINVI